MSNLPVEKKNLRIIVQVELKLNIYFKSILHIYKISFRHMCEKPNKFNNSCTVL